MGDAVRPTGTVTFLFSDIEDSTDLVRRVGNEAFATIRTDHRRILRSAFSAHGVSRSTPQATGSLSHSTAHVPALKRRSKGSAHLPSLRGRREPKSESGWACTPQSLISVKTDMSE